MSELKSWKFVWARLLDFLKAPMGKVPHSSFQICSKGITRNMRTATQETRACIWICALTHVHRGGCPRGSAVCSWIWYEAWTEGIQTVICTNTPSPAANPFLKVYWHLPATTQRVLGSYARELLLTYSTQHACLTCMDRLSRSCLRSCCGLFEIAAEKPAPVKGVTKARAGRRFSLEF